MTKNQQDFELYTGTDRKLQYTITDADGASLLVTSMTASWFLRDEPDSASILKYGTGGSNIALSGCTMTVTIPASDTSGCSLSGTYYAELLGTDSGGDIAMLAWGYGTIIKRVTL